MSGGLEAMMAILGDMPKDSPLTKAVQEFFMMLLADARNGGAVGELFKKVVELGRKNDEAAYAKLPLEQRAGVLATFNALKGAIDG